MPTWLNHDYGDVLGVDILAVDAYSVVEVCIQYIWVRLAINVGGKSFSIFFSKLKWTHPLTKLNTNKSCYVDNIWLR
jgi:hypothetical protein